MNFESFKLRANATLLDARAKASESLSDARALGARKIWIIGFLPMTTRACKTHVQAELVAELYRFCKGEVHAVDKHDVLYMYCFSETLANSVYSNVAKLLEMSMLDANEYKAEKPVCARESQCVRCLQWKCACDVV